VPDQFLPDRTLRVRWRAALRAARVIVSALLLVTCSSDNAVAPRIPVRTEMDLAGLFRAGGQIPIPVDQVLVELRRFSDSSVAFSRLFSAAQFSQRQDSLIIRVDLDLRATTEQFYLYAEARGSGVVYYTVRSTVTASAGATSSTSPLTPTYVGPGNAADSVLLAVVPGSVTAGDSALVTAVVYDNDAVLPGVPVGILSSDTTLVRPRALGLNQAWLVTPATGSGSVMVTALTPTGLTAIGTLSWSPTPAINSVTVAPQTPSLQVSQTLQLSTTVLDVNDNIVTGLPEAWVSSAPAFAAVTPTGGLVTAVAVGSATITATVGGVSGSTVVTVVPASGPASVAAQSATTQSITVNQLVTAPPSVIVRDASNQPLASVPVTFAVTVGGGALTGASPTTNASGIATVGSWRAGQTVGANSVTATVAALTPVVFTATGTATAADAVVLISGNNQTAPASTPLALPLVVEVRDSFANVVAGATVAWSTASGGSLTPASSVTAVNGQTQSLWTLGGVLASQSALATVGSLAPATFLATATFGPPAISLAFVGLSDVGVGKSATVRASIPTPAPAGGVAVTLTSDLPGTAQVVPPVIMTIPQGGTTADFTVNGVTLGSTTLRGDATGFVQGTLPISVLDRSISVPGALNVPFAGTQSLPITLGSAAPAGGVVITVISDNPAAVGIVTPTVTIPGGSTSANATVSGVLPGTANVTVDNPSYSSDVSVVTTSASLNVVQTFVTLNASFPISIDVQFESQGIPIAAPVGGVPVTLTARNAACVNTLPATIPAGQVITTSSLSAGTAPLPCTTYVVASAANIALDSVNVTVNPVPGISITASGTIGSGLQVGHSGSLGASNHGGVTVRITSADPAVVLVSPNATTPGTAFIDIPVVAGGSFFSYTVQAVEGQTGTAALTATAPGFTNGTGNITAVTPAVDIIFLPTSTTSFSPNSGFQIRLGIPNAGNTFMAQEQAVRAGAPNLVGTIVNDSAAVAQLVTTAVTGQSVTVPVVATQARSPSSVGTGGVEFDPIAAGATTVSATIPGFIQLPTAIVNVTVTAPVITLNGTNAVGSGLQSGANGSLGASNHGGTTVRITSSDPSVALLSVNASTPGTAFVDIPMLNGSTFFSYVVQGVEGQTGTPDLVATAPGFVPDTIVATVTAPALDVIFFPSTTTSLSPNSAFQVRVGVPNAGNTFMAIEQALRPGSPGVTATVSNAQPLVGQLVTTAVTGQVVTVPIVAGQARSPSGVASGGVEYDPLAPGTDAVSATIPGFIALPSATQPTTVTGAGISLNQPNTLGSGLQVGASGSLGASNHGGVTVRITSADPATVLVAPNSTTAGTAFIDIPMANGSTFFSYVVMGLEGQTGTVTLTAAAPGFSNGTTTADVAAPAIDIIFLSLSQTTFSPNNTFQVRIGVPNAGNTFMAIEEAIRFGGTPLAVTLTSATPAVGALVTQAGSGASGSVTIVPGQARSPGSLGTGGIEFDPILGGTTTVSALAPPYFSLPTASQTVTVSAPGISLSSTTVGGGLQTGISGSLGASNHGGVTVRITSSDPSIALVSPNAGTAGTAFIDIAVANGGQFFSYVVQGVEGQTGVPAITASAPGFTDGSATATVVAPAVDVIFLPTSTTTLAPPAGFQVRLGIPNATNQFMAVEQGLRAGGNVATATVTNSNASVADLQFQGGPAQSGTVSIALQAARSPGGAINGGVEFLPVGAGNTTVSVTVPGFITLPTASQTVAVAVPGISVNPVTVGAGLQVGAFASLGASNHGGVTVRVTSSDPALYLVAPNATTAGAAFVDIALPNGSTFISYVVLGLEGTTGTAAVTLSAPGFTNGSVSHTVVQPSADVIFLPSTIAVGGANVPFQIRIGIPDALGNNMSQEQALRFGATTAVATVTSGTPAVAALVTSLGSGPSASVSIAAGLARSPGTVATGGVEFDPLTVGTTPVSVTLPGFRVIAASTFTVTVQ